MNAHAFALVAQEPDGLSRLDLSNDEVVKDAEHELRRCATDAQFAAWARRWGRNAVARLGEFPGEVISAAILDESEADLARAKSDSASLRAAIDAHVKSMDRIMDGERVALQDRVNDIIAKLEEAL